MNSIYVGQNATNVLFRSLFQRLRLKSFRKVQTRSLFLSELVPSQHKLSFVTRDHEEIYKKSIQEPGKFWGELALSKLQWITPFTKTMDCEMSKGQHKWFMDGVLNVSENCLDRHVQRTPDNIALIWEKDEPGTHETVSYRELLKMTCQLSNTLKNHGIKKGDRVCLYLPNSPLAVVSMLACSRIGAAHSVVFAGFSADALASRIMDAGAETVITADQGLRGGKTINLKQMVDEAVSKCSGVKRVFVMSRTGADVPMGKIDIPLEKAMSEESNECIPEPMNSEDMLFLLYTSGSTGKPKGIQHSQAGYLLYANLTFKHVFGYEPGDIFSCVADIGWITGHSYVVYGPLSNGATSVLFESIPTYPDPGRYWEMVERLKINIFYGAPTAIRLLLKYGNDWVEKYDRSSLKVLGTVGEPINAEAWYWYNDIVGEKRCTVVDTWWQTETGGVFLAPRPGPDNSMPKPEFATRPFFGVEPVLLDSNGKELVGNNVSGNLCIRGSVPGLARTVYGDHQRFLETYYTTFPGYYFTGDGALRDEDGHYRITGRVDDVINISGHRLGTAEIEDALDYHPDVAESAVVGFPHEIKGEGIYAYVTLKEGAVIKLEDLVLQLKNLVKKEIGSFAVPEIIQVASGLPKTRSGKIMRRILRKVAANDFHDLGDVSTLAEPSVVKDIVDEHKKLMHSKS
ncbi:acetyl-coenzyme A synthetase 2-like, mitochondrial [Xenia sp. Carnegie-2017]|uniref:acetyl-coenzyme A synthetase 2-like, mitochondrial n=1 Tax=Xenia sp. Carnegie-2017 TaxID=2897299 RepID=UPI001F049B29|nr:acetyl-coenzyme A synthetase 2-like, mitochondrial [Xenia sp. Carnegie-2017]